MRTEQGHEGRVASSVYRVANARALGLALRDLRLQAGWSQEDLAERLGVRRAYVSHMEQGLETEQLRRLFAVLRLYGARMTLTKEPG